jgi:hypothetical protein
MNDSESQQPTRNLDFQSALDGYPDPGSLAGTCSEGPLAGWSLTWDRSLNWEAAPPPLYRSMISIQSVWKSDIVVDTPNSRVLLAKSCASRGELGGRMWGQCGKVETAPRGISGPRTLWRIHIEDQGVIVAFPGVLFDSRPPGGFSRTFMQISAGGLAFDIYRLKPSNVWFLEVDGKVQLDELLLVLGRLSSFLTYLLGSSLRGATCVAGLNCHGEVTETHWFSGQNLPKSMYRPIPVDDREIALARRALALPENWHPLDRRTLSAMAEKLFSDPTLITPIEYLIRWHTVPLEMRGVLLSVALESLTDSLKKVGLADVPNPIPEALWFPLLQSLGAAVDGGLVGQQNAKEAGRLKQKFTHMNEPSNAAKLTRPFERLGVPLTRPQRDAIEKRNRLLHLGRLIDHDGTNLEPAQIWAAHDIEMSLFTVVNHLFLKYLGYEGAIIDWASADKVTGNHSYLSVSQLEAHP